MNGTVLSNRVTPFTAQDIKLLEDLADILDKYMSPDRANTLVSYVVAPTTPGPGSYCYKMLIDPHSAELYYFRKHRISKTDSPGFLVEDIKRITSPRNKK